MLAVRLRELRAKWGKEQGRRGTRPEVVSAAQQVAISMDLSPSDAPTAEVLAKMEQLEGGTKSPSGDHLVILSVVYGVGGDDLRLLTLAPEVRAWAERAVAP